MPGKPQVLLVDSHEDFRREVQRLLEPEFDVVGTASDGSGALEEMMRLHPEVVVAEVQLRAMGSVDTATRLLRHSGGIKMVFLSSHYSHSLIKAVFSFGALGYVAKASVIEDLCPAIQAALEGKTFVSSSFACDHSSLPQPH